MNSMTRLVPALLLLASCGGIESEEGACAAASAHLESCFGDSAAGAFAPGSCTPDRAARVLGLGCSQLSQLVLGGKADEAGVDEAIQDAIRDAIRDAVVQAIQQAVEQVLKALDFGLGDRPFYLSFDKTSSESAAQSRAQELADILAGDPELQPTVMDVSSGYAVVHGPCPIDLASDLPERIADLVLEHPELISALGGEISVEHTEEGASVSMHLPLTLLSVDASVPAQLGCGE